MFGILFVLTFQRQLIKNANHLGIGVEISKGEAWSDVPILL